MRPFIAAKVAVVFALLGAGLMPLFAQSLIWLGNLSGMPATATGVSADGTVVAGQCVTSDRSSSFVWTRLTGMIDLGTLGGSDTWAWRVSEDGSTVVGSAKNASGMFRAFRWRWDTGIEALSTVEPSSFAYDVSADGSIVVGGTGGCAVRWMMENNTRECLGRLTEPPFFYNASTEAFATNSDASIVGGLAIEPHSWRRVAFLWARETGVRALRWGDYYLNFIPMDISEDGTVAVGADFRWSQEEGVIRLGTLGGNGTEAYAVTATGSIVVGRSPDSSGQWRAFQWNAQTGIEDLNARYASLLTPGSVLRSAIDISPDGRYIVGGGENGATGQREAYLLDTWREGDTNGDGCIDDTDLLNLLFAFGTPGSGYTRHEDINKDGIVDDSDLLIVLFSFGSGC